LDADIPEMGVIFASRNTANIRKHYVDPATATMQLIALEQSAKTG